MHRRIPDRPPGPDPMPGKMVGAVFFLLLTVLWVTSLINAYIAKVPGFWQAVEWAKQYTAGHFGFAVFAYVSVGIISSSFFSRVPEFSLNGLKFKNPLHAAPAQNSCDCDKLKRTWEQEKRQFTQKIEAGQRLQDELTQLKEALKQKQNEKSMNVASMDAFHYALGACSNQDSVFEHLFAAFHKSDTEFVQVYQQSLNWLAHASTQFTVTRDRSLNCTIMRYDWETDVANIVSQAGNRLSLGGQFLPKRGVGIGGRAISTGRAQMVDDVTVDPDYVKLGTDDTRSMLSVPVFNQKQVVGLVNVSCRLHSAFSDTDLKTIQLAADNVAVAFGLQRLREKDRKLRAVSSKLGGYLTPETATEGGETP